MRLIDADALKSYWQHALEETRTALRDEGKEELAKSVAEALYNDVDAQPTIEERKRGEWIEDAKTFYNAVNEKGGGVNEDTPFFTEDYVACSECLTLFSVIENRTEIFSFCPHCGADMRGGQE